MWDAFLADPRRFEAAEIEEMIFTISDLGKSDIETVYIRTFMYIINIVYIHIIITLPETNSSQLKLDSREEMKFQGEYILF